MNKFKVIVPCFNAEKYIGKCLESILNQTYKNFDIIVIDDASTDNTINEISKFKDNGIVVIRNGVNVGPLANTYTTIKRFVNRKQDIIVIVDGDDMLYDNMVFDKLNEAYNEGYWMTHGSYQHISNGVKRINKFDMPFDRKNRTHAVYHLRTFKRFLLDRIDESDLKENGDFFKMTGDMALLFPMIEMCGNKVKFFTDIMYLYNDLNPLSEFRLSLTNQERIEMIIRNKKSYEILTMPI